MPLPGQELEFTEPDLGRNLLQVAAHFARQGQYRDAILQYYQFLYKFPEDSVIPEIYSRIAEIYQKSNQPNLAEEYFYKAVEKSTHTRYDLENRLRLGIFLFERGAYERGLKYAMQQEETPFQLIVAYHLIRLEEWTLADSVLARFQQKSDLADTLITAYRQIRSSEVQIDWKRRWGAYLASSIIPGSGRIIFREYKEGALTAVGFFGLLTTAAYTLTHYPQFYFFAATGTLIYYIANLYATVQSVEQYNNRLTHSRGEKLIESYPLHAQLQVQKFF